MTRMRLHLLSLAMVSLMFQAVNAQVADPLELKRQEIRLKVQQLKAELNANILDAARLERSSPERSRELLRAAELLLKQDTLLPERERKDYTDDVTLRLYRMNDRALTEKKAEEAAALKRLEIEAFNRRLKADADRAQRLANSSASATIASQQKAFYDNVNAQAAQRDAMAKNAQQAGLQQQQDQFFKPPKSVVPAKDVELMRALNSTLTINFNGVPMKAVLDYLEEKTKFALNIIIDEVEFEAAKIDPREFLQDPVTKVIRTIKVRQFLKMILEPRQMGYYLEEGSLYITRDVKAKSKLVVKNYPVSNLVGGQQLIGAAVAELSRPSFPGPGGAPQLGPLGQLLGQNIDGLTAQIMGTVEPGYWKNTGGPGSMTFVPNLAALQVSASLEVHYLLLASGLLDNNPRK